MLKILKNYCHVYRKITKSRNELREFAQRVVADPYSRIVIAAAKAQPGSFQAIFSCQGQPGLAALGAKDTFVAAGRADQGKSDGGARLMARFLRGSGGGTLHQLTIRNWSGRRIGEGAAYLFEAYHLLQKNWIVVGIGLGQAIG